jgi:hypothetical protein
MDSLGGLCAFLWPTRFSHGLRVPRYAATSCSRVAADFTAAADGQQVEGCCLSPRNECDVVGHTPGLRARSIRQAKTCCPPGSRKITFAEQNQGSMVLRPFR